MSECSTPIPDCDLTCEELECRLNAIDLNITNLFERTDDINNYLGDNQWVIVTTAAELTAALPNGGTIFILGTLTKEAGSQFAFTVSVPGTRLIGLTSPDGSMAKVVNPHVVSQYRAVFNVATTDVQIRNLEITTNHPLTVDLGIHDIGIVTFGDVAPYNTSGLVIDSCHIHHVSFPIRRQSGAGVPIQERARITNNYLYSFNQFGISLDWGMDGMLIADNTITGRLSGDTHTAENGIFVANGADRTIIRNNKVSIVDRHGIEYWHSLANQNFDCIIDGNMVVDCVYGITAIGNGTIIITSNIVREARGIGIEIFNQSISNCRYQVCNNTVDDISYQLGQVVGTIGISVDSIVQPTLIHGNFIGTIESPGTAESFGLQAITECENVTIKGNTFRDAGTRMCFMNGDGVGVFRNIDISDNTFFYSEDFSALYPSPTYTEWESVRTNAVGVVAVKNNKAFYPAAETTFGIMRGTNGGTIYSGTSSEVPIAMPDVIEESNLRIPY